MATDIAFAVGVVALLGRRVPASLKLFLLALAIVDDIGAIVVIAVVYSDGISFEPLLAAALLVAAMGLLRLRGLQWLPAYVLLGTGVCLAFASRGCTPLSPAPCWACWPRPGRWRARTSWRCLTDRSELGTAGGHRRRRRSPAVSLFVAEGAFDEPGLVDAAKAGVLLASMLAAALGTTLLLGASRSSRRA